MRHNGMLKRTILPWPHISEPIISPSEEQDTKPLQTKRSVFTAKGNMPDKSVMGVEKPIQPPSTTGLISNLPAWATPYAELMRLHRPAGYYAFLFPHLFGTLLAASAQSLTPEPPSPYTVLKAVWLNVVSCLFLRGAACSYNDALDEEYDRLVARCRNRPVARGAVSAHVAHLFALAQICVWIALVATTKEARVPAALLAAIMVVYPFCKRWTNFPQVILGFSLAFGLGVGVGNLGVDICEVCDQNHRFGLAALYLANVFNTMVYDTVYAYQDIEDDLKAGVMSMAIVCLGWTKQWLGLLSMIEVSLLFITGWLMGYAGLYWFFALLGTALVLTYMLFDWDPKRPASCWKWFCWTIWLTGGTVCLGIASEYLSRLQ